MWKTHLNVGEISRKFRIYWKKKNMILLEQRFVRENVLILFPAVTLRITVKWEELVLFPPADAVTSISSWIIAVTFRAQKHIKKEKEKKQTYRHGWPRSCWTTRGCRHCSWGGKAFPWCSGWCCRVGQRTWTRCAPAPWNAWTVPLEEMKTRDQTKRSHTTASSDRHFKEWGRTPCSDLKHAAVI